MTKIARPAVKIEQGSLTLYLTYITPRDLMSKNFYTVDKLEPNLDGSGKGFQRILNDTRANRLARHLREAFSEGYANLPTTIFLATDKHLDFNSKNNTVSFDPETIGPFSVVDGQHHIEGLIRASQSNHDLLDFQLPATIGTALDDTHQMYHFYIVNTTQQPVEKGLQQQIISRFTGMNGVNDLPYLPFWFQRRVEIGIDNLAIRLANFLNESDTSPLQGRIQMANDAVGGRDKIKQASLVTMFKEHIFSASNPISIKEPDSQKLNQIILNYFQAVDNLLVDPEKRTATVVYKSNGLFFFLMISKWVFTAIYASTRNFTIKSIQNTLKRTFDEMESMTPEIADPDWWLPGGSISSASEMNRASIRRYADAFQRALSQAESADITL